MFSTPKFLEVIGVSGTQNDPENVMAWRNVFRKEENNCRELNKQINRRNFFFFDDWTNNLHLSDEELSSLSGFRGKCGQGWRIDFRIFDANQFVVKKDDFLNKR